VYLALYLLITVNMSNANEVQTDYENTLETAAIIRSAQISGYAAIRLSAAFDELGFPIGRSRMLQKQASNAVPESGQVPDHTKKERRS
jgi:hypothetical protein